MTSIIKAGLLAAAIASPSVYAADKPATQDRDVSNFSEIDVAGSFDVIVKVGPKQSVKVTADADIIDDVLTEVHGDELVIKMDHGSYRNIRTLRVDVTVPSLTAAMLSGSGDLDVDGVKGESFTLKVKGSGDASLKNAAVGEVELTVSGSGDVEASGTCMSVEASVTGSGDIDAEDLKCESADLTVTGSGDIGAYVTKSVKAVTRGSGDISVKGSPAHSDTKSTGSGDIEIK